MPSTRELHKVQASPDHSNVNGKTVVGNEYQSLLVHEDFQDVPLDPDEYPVLPWPASGIYSSWRECGIAFIQSIRFQSLMAFMIALNALVIGFETDLPELPLWNSVEHFFLVVFTGELCLKLLVLGPRKYFDHTGEDFVWNGFDFLIVSLGIFDVGFSSIQGTKSKGGGATMFRIIRLLRILRIFRIVRFLRQLYMLVFGLALAAQAVSWVTFLMTFVLYVCSIIAVRTLGRVGEGDVNYEFLRGKFGCIPISMLTLFELMTVPNLATYQDLFTEWPFLAVILMVFIIFGSYGLIALLTGVISESMFSKNQLKQDQDRKEQEDLRKILQQKCETLLESIQTDNSGHIQTQDLKRVFMNIAELFKEQGIDFSPHELEGLKDAMDKDGSGALDKNELSQGIFSLAEGIRPLSVIEIRSDVMFMKQQMVRLMEVVAGVDTHSTGCRSKRRTSLAKTVENSVRHIKRRMSATDSGIRAIDVSQHSIEIQAADQQFTRCENQVSDLKSIIMEIQGGLQALNHKVDVL